MPAHAFAPLAAAHPRGCALVVDPQTEQARRLAAMLAEQGYLALACSSPREARVQATLQPPDLLVIAAGANAQPLDLPQALALPPHCAILIIDDPSGPSESQEFAADPSPAGRIRLPRSVDAHTLRQALMHLHKGAPCEPPGNDDPLFVGQSPALVEVMRRIGLAADTSMPVFVCGETGSGKELVARCLHTRSRRSQRPFIAVNAGAISPQLFESEVFGHERGSFTGALAQHAGFFEQAEGGTLFLDEITEMPAAQQVKLLRAIESHTIRRVGGTQDIHSDVRIVAASNRDLAQALSAGWLREDLYYRLAVLVIHLPPLRQRVEDIEPLARHFLHQCGPRGGQWPRLTPAALATLRAQTWPGNARQLRNAIQRAWVLSGGQDIDAALVSQEPDPPSGRSS